MEPCISSSEEESRRLEVYMYFGTLVVVTLILEDFVIDGLLPSDTLTGLLWKITIFYT